MTRLDMPPDPDDLQAAYARAQARQPERPAPDNGAMQDPFQEHDGPREGPCECHLRSCSEPGDDPNGCPPCQHSDIYDPCPVQGFGCGWQPDPCGCCENEQRATTRRVLLAEAGA